MITMRSNGVKVHSDDRTYQVDIEGMGRIVLDKNAIHREIHEALVEEIGALKQEVKELEKQDGSIEKETKELKKQHNAIEKETRELEKQHSAIEKETKELEEEKKLSGSLLLKQEQMKEHVKRTMALKDQFDNQVIKRTELMHQLWESIKLCSTLKGGLFIKQLAIVQEKSEEVAQAVEAENIIITQGRKALGKFDKLVDLMKEELDAAIAKKSSYDKYMPWHDDARKRFSAIQSMFEKIFIMKTNTDKLGINCEALIERLEEQEEQEKLSAPVKEKKDSPSSSKEHTPPSSAEELSLARTSSDSSSSDELKERQPKFSAKPSSTAHLQAELKKNKPSSLEKPSAASLSEVPSDDQRQVVSGGAIVATKKPTAFTASQSPLTALSLHKNGQSQPPQKQKPLLNQDAQQKKCIIM